MRLLQINPVMRGNTSTGRIMREIGEVAMAAGWESYIAYSGGRDGEKIPSSSVKIPVGGKLSVAWHGLVTRMADRHGLASNIATRRFIRRVEELKPDIIHIHNVHGYFLNYRIFFDWLSRSGIPVVWTIHDCWLYTGHCYYYSFVRCDRWLSGCGDCSQKSKFPKSWFIDASGKNYITKKEAFTKMPKDKLTFIPVSDWIRGEMSRSFLKDFDYQVIHNGVDTDVFKPSDTEEVIRKYGLEGKKIILGLASIWSGEKGLGDFLKMSEMLAEDEIIVLVGLKPEQMKGLPDNIKGIAKTENVAQLAQLYSAATAFVNPTWQDNYPTVNLEAIACGTPVVTYRTGGSIEAVTPETGIIIEQGDVSGLLEAVRKIAEKGKENYSQACRSYAKANFRKEDRYADYLKLYQKLLVR